MPLEKQLTCLLWSCAIGLLTAQTPDKPPVQGQVRDDLTKEEVFQLVEARRRVRGDFFDPATHVQLARAYHDAGATVMAFRLLRFAQTRYFSAAEFLRAFHTGFHDEVPRYLLVSGDEELAAVVARTETEPESADAWREYGRRLASRGSIDEALVPLRRALDLAPESGENAASLAGVMAQTGDTEGAIELLEQFIAAHPADPDARVQLADILRRGSEEAQLRARRVLRQGIELVPTSAKLHLGMAYLLSVGEHGDAAGHHYRLAAELEPDNPTILAWYARSLLVDSQDKNRALDVYLRCWFLDPTTRESSPVYERITSLIEDGAAEVLSAVQGEREALEQFDSWNPQIALGSWALAIQQPPSQPPPPVILEMAFNHLAHDDEAVRFQAARYLSLRAPKDLDERIAALFDAEDIFVRGLAFYVGIQRWGDGVRDDVVRALDSSNDYLRYEAYSALLEVGQTWGRKLFDERIESEPSERILRMLTPR